MQHSPPPFFKQGPSAFVRLLFFAFLSLGLLVTDAYLNALTHLRQGIALVLYPVERVAMLPVQGLMGIGAYFVSLDQTQRDSARLLREKAGLAQTAQLSEQLRAENNHLRRLLGMQPRQPLQSLAVELFYEARDPFSRKAMVDRGATSGIVPGRPVIDEQGLVGQITRVFPFTAEVTLLTDRNQAVPVQVIRNGLRTVIYGGAGPGLLEVRYMAANADIQEGDRLVTSGLDGIYPPGLPVARVTRIDRSASNTFARVLCAPIGGINRNRHLLILMSRPNANRRALPAQSPTPPVAPPVSPAASPAATSAVPSPAAASVKPRVTPPAAPPTVPPAAATATDAAKGP